MFKSSQYQEFNKGSNPKTKIDKIGHLGLLAESCHKYSIEFNFLIESGYNSYSSVFSSVSNRKTEKLGKIKRNKEVNRKKIKSNERLDIKTAERKRQFEPEQRIKKYINKKKSKNAPGKKSLVISSEKSKYNPYSMPSSMSIYSHPLRFHTLNKSTIPLMQTEAQFISNNNSVHKPFFLLDRKQSKFS